MACLLVPAAEAIVVTAAYVAAKRKEQKLEPLKLADGNKLESDEAEITWSRKLSWLLSPLWGGVVLLALEHIWHGEITAFPPFLTAMSTPEGTAEMLREMATVGVAMAGSVTAVWGISCATVDAKLKKLRKSRKKQTD